jgi:hypothetical protein
MEHGWAFEKRLNELGYQLQPTDNKAVKKLNRLMRSKASDADKFAAFGIGAKPAGKASDEPDRLLGLLADKSIDPGTGELIGRFICEERDSGQLLNKAYRAMLRRKRSRAKAKA